MTRAQVQLANDRQQLMVAENDRRRAVLNLLRAMGLNLDADVELTDKLAYQRGGYRRRWKRAGRRAQGLRAELKAQQQREADRRG